MIYKKNEKTRTTSKCSHEMGQLCIRFNGAFLVLLKMGAYLITGSMALLSSLLDSAQDMLTSLVNLFAIKHAIEPADAHHRFGHGKAQALGSLGQSVIYCIGRSFFDFGIG